MRNIYKTNILSILLAFFTSIAFIYSISGGGGYISPFSSLNINPKHVYLYQVITNIIEFEQGSQTIRTDK